MSDVPEEIVVSEDGEVAFPVIEILTGRGFVTGKSGSGKSNTTSVVAEELLAHNFPLLIVDTDGEYYGLKEQFELLHVGADEFCDVQVGAGHAEKLASLALEENVPVILDVSGYVDRDEASDLVRRVVRALFVKEKAMKKPFLLVVEEVHEYLPESGGLDELGEVLIQVAKRGRKRGLGLVGISQRPAAVDKDFITQCDWLIWHRLTWDNDTSVAGRILGGEYAEEIEDLGDGEAFVMTDWDERVRRVQFRRKETFDAGATPGLEEYERPDLKAIGDELRAALEGVDTAVDAIDDGGVDETERGQLALTTEQSADESGAAESVEAERADAVEAVEEPSETELLTGTPNRRREATASSRRGGKPARPPVEVPEPRDDLVWEFGHLVSYTVRQTARYVARGCVRLTRRAWVGTVGFGRDAVGALTRDDADGDAATAAERADPVDSRRDAVVAADVESAVGESDRTGGGIEDAEGDGGLLDWSEDDADRELVDDDGSAADGGARLDTLPEIELDAVDRDRDRDTGTRGRGDGGRAASAGVLDGGLAGLPRGWLLAASAVVLALLLAVVVFVVVG